MIALIYSNIMSAAHLQVKYYFNSVTQLLLWTCCISAEWKLHRGFADTDCFMFPTKHKENETKPTQP